jgi:hypothetical protein
LLAALGLRGYRLLVHPSGFERLEPQHTIMAGEQWIRLQKENCLGTMEHAIA